MIDTTHQTFHVPIENIVVVQESQRRCELGGIEERTLFREFLLFVEMEVKFAAVDVV
jgi:hypothetical protein